MKQSEGYSENLRLEAESDEKKRQIMRASVSWRNFHVQPRMHQRQVDEIQNARAKRSYTYNIVIQCGRLYVCSICNFDATYMSIDSLIVYFDS